MVPVSSIISFFQVGAVNNGRNWARIAIMGSEWGMNFLLDKMSFCQLLSYTKRSLMPCFSTQIVQSRAKTAACVLMFHLDRAAFPIDTHVWRTARRLGLRGPKVSAA